MREAHSKTRDLVLAFLLALVPLMPGPRAAAAVSGPVDAREDNGRSLEEQTRATPEDAVMDYPAAWKRVEELVAEQRFEAAVPTVRGILIAARADEAEEEWTRALVEGANLRIALHGYEDAVRFLREQPWPESPGHRSLLNLFYAHWLTTYVRAYSWEIDGREKVASEGELDLRTWTKEQILTEAERAMLAVWSRRESWGSEPLGVWAAYLEENNYPPRIRGTVRDAVTYLWVEMLSDTSFWTASELNGVFRLPYEELLEGAPGALLEELAEPSRHPLLKLAGLLADLERWHAEAARPEAAFEARLERLRRLQASYSEPQYAVQRQAVRNSLRLHLEALGRRFPWWSMGQAQLADFVRRENDPDALIEAREAALEGAGVHRGSLGAERCKRIVVEIEAPDYSLLTMQSDGLGRRSIEVRHRNLGALHFRAYRLDLQDTLLAGLDANLLPSQPEIEALIDSGEPVLQWSVELPATPDFRTHKTFVTPPMEGLGLWVIVASARADFADSGNRRVALNLLLTEMVLASRQRDDRIEAIVRSGSDGERLAGVEVDLYRFDYHRGHRRVGSQTTDSEGSATFRLTGRGSSRYFLIARRAEDVTLEPWGLWYGGRDTQAEVSTAALIYTDRSIYRPLQDVLWKVVGYQAQERAQGDFQLMPERQLTVELVDPNGDVVEATDVETNSFGTASGSFKVPAGRLLGTWSLRTSVGGWSGVVVEEYKRPTFEVTLVDPQDPVRLNRPVSMGGEVRYYFGLPVVTGQVSWSVSRVPDFPRWMPWYDRFPVQRPETIASGTSELDEEGRFQIRFTPTVDERLVETSGVSFRYELTARVTDEGGETRSAERWFRLGFVAIEARIESERAFFTSGDPVELVVARTDLNGVARPGEGRWRLTRVEQPTTTLPPAELPRRLTPGEEDWFHTPDDQRRARWETEVSPEVELASWPDGEEIRRGAVTHGEDGAAALRLEDLAPGLYRLHYSSEDEFAAVFELSHDLLVVGEGAGRLELPMLLLAERGSTTVGETLKVLVHSGLEEQELLLEIQSDGETFERRWLRSAPGPSVLEIPVEASQRGGFSLVLTSLVDYQLLSASQSIWVPWEDRELQLSFSSFRDRLRPGGRETWRVTVSSSQGERLERGAAEVLAYMYDRSLDLFAPHDPPSVPSLYPVRTGTIGFESSLGSSGAAWQATDSWIRLPESRPLRGDRLRLFDGYGIGGPGRRVGGVVAEMAAAAPEGVNADQAGAKEAEVFEAPNLSGTGGGVDAGGGVVQLRSEFSETAFWHPHLVIEDEGAVSFEFTVPDSVTEWSVWLHALDRDLRGGSYQRQVRTVKELMVRPYLPRFLREGDRVDLVVVVNNASESTLHGELDFEILEPDDSSSLNAEFGLSASSSRGVPFSVEPGRGSRLGFPVTVPPEVGNVAFRVTARAGEYSDGELRPLPVLPGRMHLSQSRFVALQDADRREMSFAGLVGRSDPTRLDEQLVVTLDAQLFYSVLQALPYLVRYPYECSEQTLNRFLSTGIVASLFDRYPAVARMAETLSERDTRFETWDQTDPNRKLALEETPWLIEAGGGEEEDLVNVLKPSVAAAERRAALAKLAESQTALGGFPWWPGGPPSPYMTLYILQGFSRALEFGIEVPEGMIQHGWRYLHRHYLDEIVPKMMDEDCCWEFVTFLSHVLSSYPDDTWTEGLFSEDDQRQMLELSLRHWREHSPLLKSSLALALARQGREADAERVWESVMDSARTSEDEGTYWAPEQRSWLWYNDTVEGHALALRTMTELNPADPRRQGLVQWLLMNKQLNHWKSTRSTAEVIYALVHYLEQEGSLAVREEVGVELGRRTETLVFEPEEYTGRKSQIVLRGGEIQADSMSTIVIEKKTPGTLFASATWHFSTEQLPAEAEGDLFSVERRYFKRFHDGEEWILQPLAEGASIEPGDQVEVQLALRSRHAAEYVHLRDPRAAGFEPESTRSTHRWDLGISWYEEVRDSGTNFFFDWLPAGEYTFRYRLRANLGGTFRVAPATVQSMYAPEFTAYSSGALLEIETARP